LGIERERERERRAHASKLETLKGLKVVKNINPHPGPLLKGLDVFQGNVIWIH
jgi:hypothetical protein